MRNWFFQIVLAITFCAHSAAAAPVFGPGGRLCEQYFSDNAENQLLTLAWMMGYLSAAGVYEDFYLGNPGFASELNHGNFLAPMKATMQDYCRKNPKHSIQRAGNAMARQLGASSIKN